MKIIRPESEKKEVPLVSGGVYTDSLGVIYILTTNQEGGRLPWRYSIIHPDGKAESLWSIDEASAKHSVQNKTYHPNAELVLEPKR